MWTVLWDAAESGRRPDDMNLADFIRLGLQFTEYLEMHHNIEEAMLFPRLAERMPQFSRDNGELVAQHKVIHEGLEGLQLYLKDCRAGRADFELRILKQKMESWGGMLWMHMDEEVKTLGASNVRKYWSKAEFSRIII
jgi:hemerythrin-like domain-containing protein